MNPAVVLILDSNKADLLLAKRVLAKEKVFNTVCCFSDPEKAMDFLRIHRVDVVITEANLGDQRGLDFLAEAKTSGLLADKILIVISSSKTPDIVAQADLLGVSVWIDKPLNLQKLHYVVMHVPELFVGILRHSLNSSTR